MGEGTKGACGRKRRGRMRVGGCGREGCIANVFARNTAVVRSWEKNKQRFRRLGIFLISFVVVHILFLPPFRVILSRGPSSVFSLLFLWYGNDI